MSDTQISLERAHGAGYLHWYAIAPGDATRYRFGFVVLGNVHLPTSADESDYDELFPGTTPNSYVMVIVAMSQSGCYELSIGNIKKPTGAYATYFANHAGIDRYTAMAVILALGVLIESPDSVDKAAKRMREAPKYLAE